MSIEAKVIPPIEPGSVVVLSGIEAPQAYVAQMMQGVGDVLKRASGHDRFGLMLMTTGGDVEVWGPDTDIEARLTEALGKLPVRNEARYALFDPDLDLAVADDIRVALAASLFDIIQADTFQGDRLVIGADHLEQPVTLTVTVEPSEPDNEAAPPLAADILGEFLEAMRATQDTMMEGAPLGSVLSVVIDAHGIKLHATEPTVEVTVPFTATVVMP